MGTSTGTFNTAVTYTVGTSPTAITSADYNGDSRLDLAVANLGSGNVSILLGTSSGTFATAYACSVGTSPSSITSADFNADGFSDFSVICNSGSYSAKILYGSSAGTFSLSNIYTVSSPNAVTAADFDNDGKVDLAVSNSASNDVAIYKNQASGNFSIPVCYAAGQGIIALTVADLNNDGKTDIVTANNTSQNISALLNTGAGTFNTNFNYNAGSYLSAVVSGDFDHNGKDDIALASGATNGSVTVISGVGTNAVSTHTFSTYTDPTCMIGGDFNHDGNVDLAIGCYGAGLSVLLSNGSGSFTPVAAGATITYIESIASGDFNGDGNMDLIVGNYYGTLCPMLGSPTGTFVYSGGGFNLSPGAINGITSGDFNADGKADIATINSSSNTIYVMMSNGSGAFGPATNYSAGSSPSAIACADLNGDGKIDIVTTNSSSGNISILFNTGSGSFTSQVNYGTGSGPSAIVIKDIDLDSKLDLVIANNNSNNISILKGLGAGNFTGGLYGSYAGSSVSTGDLNGDGMPDIVTSNGSTNTCSVYMNQTAHIMTTSTNTVCQYGSVTLKATQGEISHNWHPLSSPDDSLTVTANGTYYFTTANLNNSCTSVSNNVAVVILSSPSANPYPMLTVNSNDTICLGSAATLTVNGANTYTWSTGVNTQSISVSPVSSVVYTVTGAINGCPNTATVNVIVLPTPTLTTTGGGSICLGNTATLTVNGANTYTWSTGVNIPSINVTPGVSTVYTVTGEGTNTCTKTHTINVNVNSLPSITVSGPVNLCIGTSGLITASGANTYTWSTGSLTPSTSVAPTITTSYTIIGKSINNCSDIQSFTITVDNTCQDVWPGDANSDGIADNLDVLELGLHFTQTGTPRGITSNLWQAYHATNWIGTITNGENVNHSDCNGDGTINDNDTLAIFNNYNLTHAFKPTAITTSSAQISVVPDQALVAKGTWGTSSIYLGDASTAINTINGVAFTVNYDKTILETDSVWIEYPTSFINASNQNLKFRKRDFSNGKLYTATTHTISGNVSGYGKIATLHYKIKSSLTTDNVLNLSIAQANQSNASGVITPLTAGSATLMAIGASVGLNELTNGNYISLHPNPTNGVLTINSTVELQKIEVMAVTGQLLMSEVPLSTSYVLHLDHLANGVYFVNLYQNNRIVKREKIILNK